ncbi:hypothetical protein BD311DRAFT_762893 [Dichomitus squalens]|uniref:Secreted protein n=1 Tax=Dichomitus squalens TaxID=114155 RepID=A0A4Q9MFU6_9APHY|nr:hypothetical protein BD311DRAFT_762893 [Dichomitus squalens]
MIWCLDALLLFPHESFALARVPFRCSLTSFTHLNREARRKHDAIDRNQRRLSHPHNSLSSGTWLHTVICLLRRDAENAWNLLCPLTAYYVVEI